MKSKAKVSGESRRKLQPAKPNLNAAPVRATPADDVMMAQISVNPIMQATSTIRAYHKGTHLDLMTLVNELAQHADDASSGKTNRSEKMLIAQAHTLDTIYNNLAYRAIKAELMPNLESYLRLALKAQSQCRATLETLAFIKNPQSVAFVRQQNVAVNQQVNNSTGAPSRAGEIENQQNKLLEAQHGERMDIGTAGTAGRADPQLAAVGTINRPENSEG